MDNKLSLIIKEQDIPQKSAKDLMEAFGIPLTEAGEIINELYIADEDGVMQLRDDALKVTDVSQTDLMKEAKVKRLTLKNIRTGVERTRKEQKEEYLKKGRAIDSIARYIKETIEPAEHYLEQQEKFAELKIAEEKAKLRADRLEKLSGYEVDLNMYNIDAMTPEQFDSLVAELEDKKQRAEAEAKAEAERLESERIAKEEEERKIREENERLRREAAEREEAERLEREKAKAAQLEQEAQTQRENARIQSIVDAIEKYSVGITTKEQVTIAHQNLTKYMSKVSAEDRENAHVKLAFVSTDNELNSIGRNIDDEVRAREEADRAAREAREKQEALEAQLKAEQAPDAEKLKTFANAMAMIRNEKIPAVTSAKGREVVAGIEEKLDDLLKFITVSVEEL